MVALEGHDNDAAGGGTVDSNRSPGLGPVVSPEARVARQPWFWAGRVFSDCAPSHHGCEFNGCSHQLEDLSGGRAV
jgi:hypothetical protein